MASSSCSLLTLSLLCLLLLSATAAPSVHDLLPEYGFPRGLIPDAVKSYTLSASGDFTVHLYRPCYVHFDQLVYYDKLIKGKLTHGSVSGVSGIQAKKLFIWLPVTGIVAEEDTGMIEFWVGAISQKLPAKQFEEIPACKNKGCHGCEDEFLVEEALVQSI